MNRIKLFGLGIGVILACAVPLLAQPFDRHDCDRDEWEHGRRHAHAYRYSRQRDERYIGRYYAGPRDLPPGLRMRYFRSLPPPPPHCAYGYIDGYGVVYDRRTRVIVDAIDLIDALSRR